MVKIVVKVDVPVTFSTVGNIAIHSKADKKVTESLFSFEELITRMTTVARGLLVHRGFNKIGLDARGSQTLCRTLERQAL